MVALGVGAGFGVSALQAQSELDEKCGGDATRCPTSLQSVTVPLADQRTRNRNVFLGLKAAAVVGIGVAVVGIIRSRSKASSSPRRSPDQAITAIHPLADARTSGPLAHARGSKRF